MWQDADWLAAAVDSAARQRRERESKLRDSIRLRGYPSDILHILWKYAWLYWKGFRSRLPVERRRNMRPSGPRMIRDHFHINYNFTSFKANRGSSARVSTPHQPAYVMMAILVYDPTRVANPRLARPLWPIPKQLCRLIVALGEDLHSFLLAKACQSDLSHNTALGFKRLKMWSYTPSDWSVGKSYTKPCSILI